MLPGMIKSYLPWSPDPPGNKEAAVLTVDEEELEILDRYLGDVVEKVVVNHGYNIDFDDDYEDVLEHIYKNIVSNWFKTRPSPRVLEEKLRYVRRRHPRKLEILISYLVSTYVQNKKMYYPRYGGRDF